MFETPQRKKKIRDSNNKGPYAPGFQMPEDEANVVDGTDVVVRNKKAISLLDSDGPDGRQQHLIAATAWCAEVLFIKQGFAQDCAVFCMEFHTGVSVAVQ